MNKQGKRFYEKRVKISKNLIKSLIYDIKGDKTLKELAINLDISYHTLRYDWLIKGNTIPLSIFRKIIKLHPKLDFKSIKNDIEMLEPFWGQKVNHYKKFSLPDKDTKEFAEFYGIMLGDGCIYSNLSGLCISGDKILEKNYYNDYLNKLIFNLFRTNPKIFYSKDNRAMRLILYSKPISKYLIDTGFPKGKKLNNKLEIPNFILNNNKLTALCIRGILDTDGSICAHQHTKIMLHLSIISDSLRNSVYKGFTNLGIKVGKYNKGIVIYGDKKLEQFFKIIGSSNPKNIIKYEQFLKTGKTPNSKETEIFLREKYSY